MSDDPWLERLLPLVRERIGSTPVLELGCGSGRDTAVLAAAGCRVVGVDLSAQAIANAQARVPSGEFHCQDLRAAFPLATASVGVIVASLSLHYFTWKETLALAERIHEALLPGGVLLCRLNSVNDHHYGASGHPEIEPDFYLVDGEPKRFFRRATIVEVFSRGWLLRQLEEKIIHRYRHPKSVWEAVLERVH